MGGIGSRIEVALVATVTVSGNRFKNACGMTGSTIVQRVSFCEREKVVVEAYGTPQKGIHFMALNAVGRQSGLLVIGIGGGFIILAVTINALYTQRLKLEL